MKQVGIFLVIAGFLFGLLMMIQLDSLHITIATDYAQKTITQDALSKDEAVELLRKYAVKITVIGRIMYLPLVAMFIGGVSIFVASRKQKGSMSRVRY